MKTTIDIPEDLALRAKAFAARKNITLRAVIERGIRKVLSEEQGGEGFKLRDASVNGNGLQQEYAGVDWSRIREEAYKGRGS